MPRPVWSGTLSFGLLNIPVSLMSGEKPSADISFRMLDSRNNAPVKYERVNAETGEEVPWKDIVKAYEYEKGSFVVLDPEDIKSAAPESHDAIDVEGFVDADAIGPQYFEKPYVLVPQKKAEKGYVLLREALQKTGKIGIARVVIRTRESLCAVIPEGDALLLMMMRYPGELVDVHEYNIPEGAKGDYRITPKELEFSQQLIETMASEWQPDQYKDEFRARLQKVIKERMEEHGVVHRKAEAPEAEQGAATNVVDFMSLLQQSIANNSRTPAKKASRAQRDEDEAGERPARAAAKKTAKRATTRKAAKKTGKTTRRKSA
ncbi:MAG: Ku protein [Lysobacteraceae bacterium]